MDLSLLVWPGAGIALLGILGILGCIRSVLRARKQGKTNEEMVAHMHRISAWNMASLGVAAIGMALVTVGLILT